ncbi:hypothetical protein HGRIS_014895 [Hohenbuehelia grisea]|uniref:Uncharacterized protein n=1 Tax=Hohenbuehelia grisea TaxID=104357 RepID=A0ABR3IQG1_9AGAR
MARNKRRRESDEASSPHTSDSATDDITLESPHTPDAATTDEATLESLLPKIRSWLDQPDNSSLAHNRMLKRMVKDAPKEICDLVLGPEGNRVLANIEHLQKLKGLDKEVILVKMWVDPPVIEEDAPALEKKKDSDVFRLAFVDATLASWQGQYYGDACRALWNYICTKFPPNEDPHAQSAAEVKKLVQFYAFYIVLFQSSGTGKSRVIDELAKSVFLIPICLRGDSHGYPPVDAEVRRYLVGGDNRASVYARCWVFLQALFIRTAKVLEQDEFKELDYTETARLFRQKMTENMMGRAHNTFRQEFYREVVQDADSSYKEVTTKFNQRKKASALDRPHVSPRSKKLNSEGIDGPTQSNLTTIDMELMGLLLAAWSKLDDVLKGRSGVHKAGPRVLISFDESHDLTAVKQGNDVDPLSWSNFGELRATLRALKDCSLFTIFLSTTGRFSQFTPLTRDDMSSRVYNHSLKLIPPYCDIGFDVLALASSEKLDLTGKWTLRKVVGHDYMTLLGRPLFGLIYRRGNDQVRNNVLNFAIQKLTNHHTEVPTQINFEQATACLAFRLPIEFLSTTYINRDKEFKQVEGHLRICLKPTTESESMVTISPSEPFVSEAAAKLLETAKWDSTGRPAKPIEILKELMTGFSIHAGDRGEFIALLLFTIARDALARLPEQRILSLPKVMRSLIAPGTSTDRHLQKMASDFPDAVMHFNHFVRPHQQKIIHRDLLLLLMGRGAGVLCAPNTRSIDFALPFLVHDDSIKPSNFGAILVQVKNDQKYTAKAQPPLFQEIDPYKIGVLNQGDAAVPLIKIFMTLSSVEAGITIVRHKPTAAYDAIVYDIWIAGLTPEVYAPITKDDQSIWLAALAATRRWESIYNAPRRAPEMRAIRQSAHPGAAALVDHWRRWVDLPACNIGLDDESGAAPADVQDAGQDAGVGIAAAQPAPGPSKSTSGSSAPRSKRAKRGGR